MNKSTMNYVITIHNFTVISSSRSPGPFMCFGLEHTERKCKSDVVISSKSFTQTWKINVCPYSRSSYGQLKSFYFPCALC